MNILVTGGNGFIGSNFIDYLLMKEQSEFVTNIDMLTDVSSDWIDIKYLSDERYNRVNFNICDIDLKWECVGDQYDVCVHFAAESHVDRALEDTAPFIKTNIQGTLAVAQYCAKHDIKMIHISTDEVYGHFEEIDKGRFTIKDPLAPRNPYAASKAAAEIMLEAFAISDPTFQYQIVRPSNNYGPHQDMTKFVPKMINSIYQNKPFPMYGQGDFYREWTHVEDTCRAILEVIEDKCENGSKHNVSSNELFSNFEFFMMTTEMMRAIKPDVIGNIAFIKDPRGNCHDKVYSISNTVRIGYKNLANGMQKLVEEFFNSDNSQG